MFLLLMRRKKNKNKNNNMSMENEKKVKIPVTCVKNINRHFPDQFYVRIDRVHEYNIMCYDTGMRSLNANIVILITGRKLAAIVQEIIILTGPY